MKKVLLALVILLPLCFSCKYDDSELWNEVNDLVNRVTRLEKQCNEINTNIGSLQTVIKALEKNDYITNVAPIYENSVVVGYTITFAKNGSITLYNGHDGTDGDTPDIGVKKDSDGIYYWTINGKWLLDENNKKIKAEGKDGKDGENGKDGKDGKDGITPQFKIENDYWYVSYDNGQTWKKQNKAKGEDGETPEIDIKKDNDGVYYWTINGDWLLDDNNKKIKVEGQDGKDGENGEDGKDGITPQLKIENDYWYISYNNGQTWKKLDKSKGEDGKDGTSITVTEDSDFYYLNFTDGTILTFPKASNSKNVPKVTTYEPYSITSNYAVVSGRVENVESEVNVGIIYDTTQSLSETQGEQVTKTASGYFAATLSNLKSETTYYYRAFAIVNGKYYFGEIKSFTTEEKTSIPIVETGEVISITSKSAKISGIIKNTTSETAVGIIYDTTESLSETEGKQQKTVISSGSFSVTIEDLKSGTNYYYRAFAIVNGKYYYGEIKSFKTEEPVTTGEYKGYQWVDLGLPSGTKWATCNVGAPNGISSKSGSFFAWGEYTSKIEYNWSNYQYSNGSSMNNIGSNIAGTSFDAASRERGSTLWAMPTKDQMEELITKCTASWTQVDGKDGMLFTGPNGNTIFLPLTGFNNKSEYANSSAYYWTGTRAPSQYHAYFMSFDKTYNGGKPYIEGAKSQNSASGLRWSGFKIRPVLNK